MAASKKKASAKKATVKKSPVKVSGKRAQAKAPAQKAAGQSSSQVFPSESSMALKPGMKAPDFKVLSETGEPVTLKQFLGKTVVLYFYPKDLTPGCTQEACDFRDSFARLKSLGAVVLGVSKDSVASHAKFRDAKELNFTLLADTDGALCEAYGVWKEKSMYGRKYMGIERCTFVIDRKGRIQTVFEKVKVKGHVEEVIEAIRSA